jgi:16S rRNA (cytidine1402-2'-O)-methyltransferase
LKKLAEEKNQIWDSPTLYMVATPIGNLEDITIRAVRVLKAVDLITAEGPAHTKELCRHYGIRTRIIALNQHNQRARAEEVLERLEAGGNVAYVSNAGTPGISDPGSYLAERILKAGMRVCPIPGPSAITGAVSVSGLPAEGFLFAGFLPNRAGARRSELMDLAAEKRTLVFLEAPHRVKETLKDMLEVLGDRPLTMAREMTKIYEEVRRGTVSTILQYLRLNEPRGEFTLVVGGGSEEKIEGLDDEKIVNIIELILKRPVGIKDTALRIAEVFDLPFRKVYRLCLARHKPPVDG